MRPILWILLGALIMFVLLKILAKGSATTSQTTLRLKALAVTPQVTNLIRTNEFREVIRTNEFKKFILTLASEQVGAISQALTGSTPQK